jgi:hypothetical protein
VDAPLRIALVGLVATALAACSLFPRPVPGPYTPEVVGVVVSTELTEDDLARYRLANGETFTVNHLDERAQTTVYRQGDVVGALLLGGTGPERPWIALVAPGTSTTTRFPAGCYALFSWGTDEGDWIQTDVGLRLRKAPGFDPGLLPETPDGPVPTAHPGERYEGPGFAFCLDSAGFVTAYTY